MIVAIWVDDLIVAGKNINQNRYINSILERFGLLECNPVSTPIAAGIKLQKSTPDDFIMDNSKEYPSTVGSQCYAPDPI